MISIGFLWHPTCFWSDCTIARDLLSKIHFPVLIDMNDTIGETSSLYTNNNDSWNDWIGYSFLPVKVLFLGY